MSSAGQEAAGTCSSQESKSVENTYVGNSQQKNQIDVYDHRQKEIDERERKIQRLERKLLCFEQEQKESENRSIQLTREMARVMDLRGTCEDLNDEDSNSRLSERFQNIYSNDWVKLVIWITNSFPDIAELYIIQYLTQLMKNGYQECTILADNQIRQFLYLDKGEPFPDDTKQYRELLFLRRTYARTQSMRMKIKETVLGKITLAIEQSHCFNLKGEEEGKMMEKIKEFFGNYIDCCWLMVSSNAPMKLNFEVVGKAYEEYREFFSEYSLKRQVENTAKEGIIHEVVWPSVSLKDGSAYYKKGDLVVVKRERETCTKSTDPNKNVGHTAAGVSDTSDSTQKPVDASTPTTVDDSTPVTVENNGPLETAL